MGEQDKRCRGIGRAAWGYFFVFFSLKLGNLELLPDFAGHLLFLGAIALLAEEERTLALLRPISILLAALSGLEWAAALLGNLRRACGSCRRWWAACCFSTSISSF